MKPLPLVALGVTAAGATAGVLFWMTRKSRAAGNPHPDHFAIEAAAGQWADMETARLALQTSKSAEVQFFAQLILDHNRHLNSRLSKLADDRGIHIVNKADLTSILKEKMLGLRSADRFDMAYAAQQDDANSQRIDLYRNATRLKDIDLANFARQGLEKMQEHQKMSRALMSHLQQPESASGASAERPTAPQSRPTQVTGSAAHLSKGVPQQTRGDAINPRH